MSILCQALGADRAPVPAVYSLVRDTYLQSDSTNTVTSYGEYDESSSGTEDPQLGEGPGEGASEK